MTFSLIAFQVAAEEVVHVVLPEEGSKSVHLIQKNRKN